MTDVTPNDFLRSPVERMAQRLLREASFCPSLIERDWPAGSLPTQHRWELPRLDTVPNLSLLCEPSLDVREYLEDLVALAAQSAEQAEAVSVQAREVSRKMRRGMAAVASFGMLGLLIGVMGFATAHHSNVVLHNSDAELTAMRQQVTALEDIQRQTHDQLSQIAAKPAARSEVGEAAERTDPAPVQAVPTGAPTIETPVFRYSDVWPDTRRPQPRRVAPARSRPVIPVFVALQRNISALFR